MPEFLKREVWVVNMGVDSVRDEKEIIRDGIRLPSGMNEQSQ